MTIDDAFKLRDQVRAMHKTEERVTAMVIENILRGEYDKLKDAKSVAEDDIKFLSRS